MVSTLEGGSRFFGDAWAFVHVGRDLSFSAKGSAREYGGFYRRSRLEAAADDDRELRPNGQGPKGPYGLRPTAFWCRRMTSPLRIEGFPSGGASGGRPREENEVTSSLSP